MAKLQKILNILFIYVLCTVLLSGYAYQFIKHEEPCPLCLLQRLGMIGISIGLFMNLRFGIKAEHYGLSLLSAVVGRFVSLRQIGLHICPQFSTFGEPVLGFDLYVWAFIVFTCSVIAIAILLILFGYTHHQVIKPTWGILEKIAFALTALIVLGNIVTTLTDCGFSACT
jgi:disulfide bond formation protein DsbB